MRAALANVGATLVVALLPADRCVNRATTRVAPTAGNVGGCRFIHRPTAARQTNGDCHEPSISHPKCDIHRSRSSMARGKAWGTAHDDPAPFLDCSGCRSRGRFRGYRTGSDL